MNNDLAKEEEVLNCLRARMTGIHIQEANKYISQIEVIIYNINLINIAKFHEHQNIWKFIF
jgi:hypothetical protein